MNCTLILFLFKIEWYVTNKKWHMRSLSRPPSPNNQDIWLLAQERPQTNFTAKSRPKIFFIKNQLKTRCCHCLLSLKWISCKSDKIWNFGNKKFLRQFWLPLNFKIGRKLACSLFLYGESEKNGPKMICRPPRFPVLRILLTLHLLGECHTKMYEHHMKVD